MSRWLFLLVVLASIAICIFYTFWTCQHNAVNWSWNYRGHRAPKMVQKILKAGKKIDTRVQFKSTKKPNSSNGTLKEKTKTKGKSNSTLKRNSSEPLTILLWSPRSTSSWKNYFKRASDVTELCWDKSKSDKQPSCIFTENKTLANEAEALVYIGTEEKGAPLPPRDKMTGKSQIRILFLREAPFWFGIQKQKFPDDFNWTMTYRTDSEIVAPYGKFKIHPKNGNFTNLTMPLGLWWKDIDLNNHAISLPKEKLQFYTGKYIDAKLKAKSYTKSNVSKLIAWTVSHCQTLSRRELLVKQLQKFIAVDIYGQCGPFKCSIPRYGKAWKSCYEQLGRKYKFFLAFENNLCEDYVTEKLFYSLKNNMVPVVYGGADYKKLAPPGSFINILDFPSIPALVAYLQFLDKNPSEYLKYFLWREKYELNVKPQFFCDICTALWRRFVKDPQHKKGRKLHPKYSKYYKNISDWWFSTKYENWGGKTESNACRLPTLPQFHIN